MRYARRTYVALLAGVTLWCVFILLPPFLPAAGETGRVLADTVFAFFHLLCHQLDDRTYHLRGVPLAVCARCASIYFGFLAGTIAYPMIRDLRRPKMPGRAFITIAALPMLLDVGLGVAGLHEVTNLSRTITGGWFGFLVPMVVIPGTIEGVEQILTPPYSPMSSTEKGLDDA